MFKQEGCILKRNIEVEIKEDNNKLKDKQNELYKLKEDYTKLRTYFNGCIGSFFDICFIGIIITVIIFILTNIYSFAGALALIGIISLLVSSLKVILTISVSIECRKIHNVKEAKKENKVEKQSIKQITSQELLKITSYLESIKLSRIGLSNSEIKLQKNYY